MFDDGVESRGGEGDPKIALWHARLQRLAGMVEADEVMQAVDGSANTMEGRKKNAGGTVKSGVSAAAKTKSNGDKTAKGPLFTPGGQGGPGRPKAVTNKDYIDAIKAEFPPEEITRLLRAAINIAVSTKSWRGVVAALEFSANYSLGKPKQQVEATAGAGLAALMAGVDGNAPLLPEDAVGGEAGSTNAGASMGVGAIGTDNLELSEAIPPADEGDTTAAVPGESGG